jgi:photosystem II stability/assembly factor-like uncharacterized protein
MRTPLLALLAGALAGACSPPDAPHPPRHPEPTEHRLAPDAERSQKARRKAWFEQRHRSPPKVDWRALERANGERQIEKRNALSGARGGDPPAERLVIASPWVERGSDNQAGRVHAAAHSPAPGSQALYAGSSLGGLWRGARDGTGWRPLGDNLYGGAHWLAVVSGEAAGDPDVVLAATDGGLVHVTRDEGATWQVPAGLGSSVSAVRRVLVASDGSESVFVVRRRSGNYGLLRSTDRLASFTQVYSFGTFAGDVWARRDGSPDLYLLDDSGLLRSTDFGDTWTPVGPAPASGARAELTGSEAGAPRLWSVIDSGSLYRSNDGGASWAFVTAIGDYWGSLNASIVSVDLFAYGGVELHRTFDGGASFAVVNGWGEYYGDPAGKLHADIPGIEVVPDPGFGELWYVCTDGGLYRSRDLLLSVENLSLSGLRVSQYYSTHTSRANPLHVVAGAQDQGYQRAPAGPAPTTTVLDFAQLISGDYGHLSTGDGDHDYLYSTYPGFILIQVGENVPSLHFEDFPSGEDHAWLPPVVADPLDPRHFFFCASRLWRYQKTTTNNWNPSLWSSFDFGLSAGEYVSALAFSPLDAQRAYAATDRGRLFHSSDHGLSWTESTTTGPSAHYFYGTALLPSAGDVDTVLVGGSGYGGPAIWRSTDGGLSFQGFATGLPPTLVYCLAEAPDGSGTYFCGTETAAYRRDAGASSWTDITAAEAPVTIYWSVEALPHENTMRFGTYGRGIWDYQLDLQARALVRNGSGLNPPCLASVNPPELGSSWSVTIDSAALPGASSSFLIVRESPASGPTLPQGELLIAGPRLLAASKPASGGLDPFSFPIPNDPALVGASGFSQGFLLGPAIELCNALDVVVGY